jgi:apolipoprotein D and lipocalin family protein
MKLLATVLSLLLCLPSLALATTPLTPVSQLDLRRYQGVWYEIANYPNRFQKMCVGGTTATYTIQPGGDVEVLNRCRKSDGTWAAARGAARVPGGPGSARLQVRFAPAWLSWLSAVWAPYWVFDIDRDYTLAAVGEPSREYLWILSRSPTVDPVRYQALLERIRAAGYDVTRLSPTPQP